MKKYKKIVLAGGNGYLGKVLAKYYSPLADEIIILSRTAASPKGIIKTLVWDGINQGDWVTQLENAELLINLCGKNVNCRYNDHNKAEIINSRILPTLLLGNVIAQLNNPPKLWINITSATIYRHAEDRPQDEYLGEIGTGFSVDVCHKWEKIFFESITPDTRKVALRMGIVLGMSDSAFPRLLNLVKFGLGGKQGDGKQYVSWIHENDAARSTEWILQHTDLSGTINCTTPQPVQNKTFMVAIRKAKGKSFGLAAPAWLLNLGAIFIGTETELILKSRWVLPTRLLSSGFTFKYPEINLAVKDLLKSNH